MILKCPGHIFKKGPHQGLDRSINMKLLTKINRWIN